MDWNKTKSIFIIVFSILNIFLYSLYVNRADEFENVSPLGNEEIGERLSGDNITIPDDLPESADPEPYLSGTRATFTEEMVNGDENQVTIQDGTLLQETFNDPLALPEEKDKEALEAFLEEHIYLGEEYVLWEVEEEENRAIFFQVINGKTLYYSDSGKVVLYWNEEGEATRYEQTIFEDLVKNKQEKELISPRRAVETLYQKSVLQPNTRIDGVDQGYSVYVPVSDDIRMFVPTWRVRATLEDDTKKEFYVNAVKDTIIELKQAGEEEGIE